MYYSGEPPSAETLVWYTNANNWVAACNPGNQHGCGDHVVVYEAVNGTFRKQEAEEISVCGS